MVCSVQTSSSVKRYERLLHSYGLNMSYQPKKNTQAAGITSGPVAGPSTEPRKRKSPKAKRGDPEKADKADDAGDEEDTAGPRGQGQGLNDYKY